MFDSLRGVVIKCFAVTLGTFRSPLTPLKKGGTVIKVSLFKGDLEGSKTFDTDKRTSQTSSKLNSTNSGNPGYIIFRSMAEKTLLLV